MTSIAEGRIATVPPRDARAARRARARLWDRVVTGLLWALVVAVVALLAYFIIYTLVKGASVISWDFLTKSNVAGDFIGAQLFNTFYIIVLALLISVPLAVSGAIYLVEYAGQNVFTTILRFATETLAGVPSLVLGLFGFLVFTTNFGEGSRFGFSRLAGALTLVILNLPLLLRVCEDALRAVPNDLREASAALGATKSQTVFKVLIPSALAGLTTGVILTAGKMLGETAALVFTAGSSSSINGWFSLDPLRSGETLTVLLYQLKAEGLSANAAQVAAGTSAVLILLLLIFNLGLRGISGAVIRRVSGSTR